MREKEQWRSLCDERERPICLKEQCRHQSQGMLLLVHSGHLQRVVGDFRSDYGCSHTPARRRRLSESSWNFGGGPDLTIRR